MSFLGSLASGLGGALGSGAVGKLFGGGDKKPYTRHLKYGIRWKVDDAKKAGIHPLYALGANVGSPVQRVNDEAQIGAQAGRAFQQSMVQTQQREHEVNIEKMRAEADQARAQAKKSEAEAALTASQVARVQQRNSHGKDVLRGPLGEVKIDPTMSPAEAWENQYGGVVGESAGLMGFFDALDAFGMKKSVRKYMRSRRHARRRSSRKPHNSDYVSP